MPHLDGNLSPGCMNGVGYLSPARKLFRRIETGNIGVNPVLDEKLRLPQ